MVALAFDTLKAADDLRSAGLPDEQAKAIIRTVQAGAGIDLAQVATKQDMRDLEIRIDSVKHSVELVRREIELAKRDMTIRLGSMLVVAVGVMAALVKLL